MTVIEELTREQALREREEIRADLEARYETTDRDRLTEISYSDFMPEKDLVKVQRLQTLDALLDR